MTLPALRPQLDREAASTALESGFPIMEISQISEQESWRKEIYRPLYHIHKWWATRLGSVFRAITLGALTKDLDIWDNFYKRHRLTGKIVLDPFMGSGTTIGEAVKLGAKAVGCDINPVSTFLVRQSLTRVSEQSLRLAFRQLESGVASDIRHYYQTRDPETGEDIPVLYFFWVKTVRTANGESLPLFDRYIFSQDAYPKKKPKARIVCPSCWALIEDRYDRAALTCPSCHHSFNPQKGPVSGQYIATSSGRQRIKDLLPPDGSPPSHRLYALLALRSNGDKVYLQPSQADFDLYAEAQSRLATEALLLPTLPVRQGHNTDQARGYNYLNWRDFFNARQLLCLGLLLKEIVRIEDEHVREQMICLFSSTLEFNNLFCSYKGEGTGAVRHMFSHHILKPERTPIENSVWGTCKGSGTFSTLFESRLMPAKRYLDQPFEVAHMRNLFDEISGSEKLVASDPINVKLAASWQGLIASPNGVLILNGDSSSLPLPDLSVDAVVTDPPYFDFVNYSELSDFFFAWLAPTLKDKYAWFDQPDSSHPAEVQHNDPHVFARHLASVFSECHRTLKDAGVLAFSFHHSRTEGWAAIYEAISTTGFAVVAAHPVHAELRCSSPKTATKEPISLDAILVCRKTTVAAPGHFDRTEILRQSQQLTKKLSDAGMSISRADEFVVLASRSLISASAARYSVTQFKDALDSLREQPVGANTVLHRVRR